MNSQKQEPIVAVIMPVYNAAKYLPDVLESILAQTYQEFEIVAVNDGSTDESAAVLARYAARDARIRVITQENAGCGAARNRAIALARGKYIAQQDADDLSAPMRLEKQVAFLDSHPDIAAVYCRIAWADENLRPSQGVCIPEDDAAIRRALPRGNILSNCFMMRAHVLRAISGYRDAFLCSGDYDLHLRLIEVGKIWCLPEALYIVRKHAGQISTTQQQQQDEYGTLAKVFARERKKLGRDSYDAFASKGGFDAFLKDYAFRYEFNLFVAARKMRRLDIADARPYLKRALRRKAFPFKALALLAASYVPRGLLQAVRSLKNRYLDKPGRASSTAETRKSV
jgi:glycosyltransferase involved in cell wall biosynthesis